LAALLSALVPGAGQLLLARGRRGIVLLLVFGVLVSCVWPLRLPRFFAPFILVGLGWLVLSFYAACTALFEHRNPPGPGTPKWWIVVIPLLSYIGINVVFTPLFLFAGFRELKFNSSAMEKTLFIGDQFIIDKTSYGDHSVTHNDLVVLRRQDYQTVKRVIAIGGDTIEGKNRQIMVNGQLLAESFIWYSLAPGANPEMEDKVDHDIAHGLCIFP
jgi:signal peptidase I